MATPQQFARNVFRVGTPVVLGAGSGLAKLINNKDEERRKHLERALCPPSSSSSSSSSLNSVHVDQLKESLPVNLSRLSGHLGGGGQHRLPPSGAPPPITYTGTRNATHHNLYPSISSVTSLGAQNTDEAGEQEGGVGATQASTGFRRTDHRMRAPNFKAPDVPLPATSAAEPAEPAERRDLEADVEEQSCDDGAAPPPPHDAGGRFETEWELGELLGRGGFGCVYRARHLVDLKDYAVKVVVLDGGQSSSALEEARTLARVSEHPNIVRYHTSWMQPISPELHDQISSTSSSSSCASSLSSSFSSSCAALSQARPTSRSSSSSPSSRYSLPSTQASHLASSSSSEDLTGEPLLPSWSSSSVSSDSSSNALFLQMELLTPLTLKHWLNDDDSVGQVKLQAIRDIFSQVLEALAHIHAQGFVHRDIKPDNIFVAGQRSDGSIRIKVGDFGLAAPTGQTNNTQPLLVTKSQPAAVNTCGVGTPSYASPEQTKGAAYDHKADMYSVGMMMLETLCGPFSTGMERAQVLGQIRQGQLPQGFQHQFPEFSELVLALTASSPAARPSAKQCLGSPVFRPSDVNTNQTNLRAFPNAGRMPSDSHTEKLATQLSEMERAILERDDEIRRLREQLLMAGVH